MLPTVRVLSVLALLLATPLAAQESAPYTLRPGDRVTVDVFTAAAQRPDEITPEVIQMRVHAGDWIHVPARRRARVRDELTVWGSIVTFVTGVATLIIITTRR